MNARKLIESYVGPVPPVEMCCIGSCRKPATVKAGHSIYFPLCAEHYALLTRDFPDIRTQPDAE